VRAASFFGILALFLSAHVLADEGLLIRLHTGVGVLDGGSYQHAGLRVLFDASTKKKYGLELTRVNTKQGDYLAAGIVLEKIESGWFNMSIGTIGYFGMDSTTSNIPGLVANLGWEPETVSAFKPFITLRNEILFGAKTRAGTALSAGVAMKF
jgi:hypothetical protein